MEDKEFSNYKRKSIAKFLEVYCSDSDIIEGFGSKKSAVDWFEYRLNQKIDFEREREKGVKSFGGLCWSCLRHLKGRDFAKVVCSHEFYHTPYNPRPYKKRGVYLSSKSLPGGEEIDLVDVLVDKDWVRNFETNEEVQIVFDYIKKLCVELDNKDACASFRKHSYSDTFKLLSENGFDASAVASKLGEDSKLWIKSRGRLIDLITPYVRKRFPQLVEGEPRKFLLVPSKGKK